MRICSGDMNWSGLAQDRIQMQVPLIPEMCCDSNKKLPDEGTSDVIKFLLQHFTVIRLGQNSVFFWKSSK
jgi:hypothetical protein